MTFFCNIRALFLFDYELWNHLGPHIEDIFALCIHIVFGFILNQQVYSFFCDAEEHAKGSFRRALGAQGEPSRPPSLNLISLVRFICGPFYYYHYFFLGGGGGGVALTDLQASL